MKRRRSVLEQVISAFGAKRSGRCPFTKKAPANIKTFEVPVEVRALLGLADKWEKAAAKLVGNNGGCNDGGMWLRRHTIGDATGYFVNDYVRAFYRKDDRHSVDYWREFKCSFSLPAKVARKKTGKKKKKRARR
jgi:hypothetical protein